MTDSQSPSLAIKRQNRDQVWFKKWAVKSEAMFIDLVGLQITWGSCWNADSAPADLEWSLSICISNKLPRDADDLWTTLLVSKTKEMHLSSDQNGIHPCFSTWRRLGSFQQPPDSFLHGVRCSTTLYKLYTTTSWHSQPLPVYPRSILSQSVNHLCRPVRHVSLSHTHTHPKTTKIKTTSWLTHNFPNNPFCPLREHWY